MENEQKQEMKKQILQQEKTIKQLQNKLESAKKQIQQQESENLLLNQMLKDQLQKSENLEREVSDRVDVIQKMKGQISDLEVKLSKLDKDLEIERTNSKESKSKDQQFEHKIRELQLAHDEKKYEFQSEIKSLTSKVQEKDEILENLEKQLENKENLIKKLKSDVSDLQDSQLQKKIEFQQRKIKQLENEVYIMTKNLGKQEQKFQEIIHSTNVRKNEIQDVKEELDQKFSEFLTYNQRKFEKKAVDPSSYDQIIGEYNFQAKAIKKLTETEKKQLVQKQIDTQYIQYVLFIKTLKVQKSNYLMVNGNEVTLSYELTATRKKVLNKRYYMDHIFHDPKIFAPVVKKIFVRKDRELEILSRNHYIMIYGQKYTNKKILFYQIIQYFKQNILQFLKDRITEKGLQKASFQISYNYRWENNNNQPSQEDSENYQQQEFNQDQLFKFESYYNKKAMLEKLSEMENYLSSIKTHQGYTRDKFHYLREYENPCKIREFKVQISYNKYKNVVFQLVASSVNKQIDQNESLMEHLNYIELGQDIRHINFINDPKTRFFVILTCEPVSSNYQVTHDSFGLVEKFQENINVQQEDEEEIIANRNQKVFFNNQIVKNNKTIQPIGREIFTGFEDFKKE